MVLGTLAFEALYVYTVGTMPNYQVYYMRRNELYAGGQVVAVPLDILVHTDSEIAALKFAMERHPELGRNIAVSREFRHAGI